MVAINDEVWYEDGAPLTQKVCEDLRQPDDVAPQLNYECGICDEAKYEVSDAEGHDMLRHLLYLVKIKVFFCFS